jgi:aminoglycoside N3'-acetyltransferase
LTPLYIETTFFFLGESLHEMVKMSVCKDDVKAGLLWLGLQKGCTVGAHCSLSSFGYVEGGADVVIDALHV